MDGRSRNCSAHNTRLELATPLALWFEPGENLQKKQQAIVLSVILVGEIMVCESTAKIGSLKNFWQYGIFSIQLSTRLSTVSKIIVVHGISSVYVYGNWDKTIILWTFRCVGVISVKPLNVAF